MVVDLLVEGLPDEAAGRKLLSFFGMNVGTVFGKRGATYIRQKLDGFSRRASHNNPLLVLIDFMDIGVKCERDIQGALLPSGPRPRCLVRGVVQEIESWALADSEGVRSFLGIPVARIPNYPERERDPKLTFINLARKSRNKARRLAIVPDQNTSAAVGPGYTLELVEFFHAHWNAESARKMAPSLDRCMKRVAELKSKQT